jgi:hypothetical protein
MRERSYGLAAHPFTGTRKSRRWVDISGGFYLRHQKVIATLGSRG